MRRVARGEFFERGSASRHIWGRTVCGAGMPSPPWHLTQRRVSPGGPAAVPAHEVAGRPGPRCPADALGDWLHCWSAQRAHVLGQRPLDEGVRSQQRGKRCFRGAPGTRTRALGRHGGESCRPRQSPVSAHAQRARRPLAPHTAGFPQGGSARAGAAHGPDAPGAPRVLAAENPETQRCGGAEAKVGPCARPRRS